MTTLRVTKILLACMLSGTLFLSGCANFIRPEVGAVARPDARIKLVGSGVEGGVWNTKDLVVTYSYTETGKNFNISGELTFDRSLTDSFPVTKKFFLKMSFLDGEGRVLNTVDITPLIGSFSRVPDKLSLRSSCERPTGAGSIAFNYYGVFRGDSEAMGGDEWDIFYFPFD